MIRGVFIPMKPNLLKIDFSSRCVNSDTSCEVRQGSLGDHKIQVQLPSFLPRSVCYQIDDSRTRGQLLQVWGFCEIRLEGALLMSKVINDRQREVST